LGGRQSCKLDGPRLFHCAFDGPYTKMLERHDAGGVKVVVSAKVEVVVDILTSNNISSACIHEHTLSAQNNMRLL